MPSVWVPICESREGSSTVGVENFKVGDWASLEKLVFWRKVWNVYSVWVCGLHSQGFFLRSITVYGSRCITCRGSSWLKRLHVAWFHACDALENGGDRKLLSDCEGGRRDWPQRGTRGFLRGVETTWNSGCGGRYTTVCVCLSKIMELYIEKGELYYMWMMPGRGYSMCKGPEAWNQVWDGV